MSEKLQIIDAAARRTARGESWRSVGRSFGVQPSQIKIWKAQENRLKTLSKTVNSVHRGRPNFLQQHEETIISWVLDRRDRGVPVEYSHVVRKAQAIEPRLAEKGRMAAYMVVRRLLIANEFSMRQSTRKSQEHPQVMRDKSLAFMAVARPIVLNPNVQGSMVFNMDQTSVWYSFHPKKTLHTKGDKNIPVISSDTGGSRATVAICISSAGDMLKPMLIFKGEKNGRIATREFPQYENRELAFHACHPSAWMNEEYVVMWIEQVFRPYIQVRAMGAPVILFLDSFSAHKTAGVAQALQNLGVQLHIIPGGITGNCQPVDVGINKPFKKYCKDEWEKWLDIQDLDADGITTPKRQEVSLWVTSALGSLSRETIRNAWRKKDFSWFPNEEQPGVNQENVDL